MVSNGLKNIIKFNERIPATPINMWGYENRNKVDLQPVFIAMTTGREETLLEKHCN